MASESNNPPKVSAHELEPRVISADRRPEVHEPLLRWRAPEFIFYEKSRQWFLLAGLSVLVLVAGALLLHQWLTAIVLVVLGAVVYQHAGRAPGELDCTVTQMGIQVGERFYNYHELKAFWVVFQPPVQTLNLVLTRRIAPMVVVQLDGVDPNELREILRQHLPEEEKRGEDWVDRLARVVRF